MGQNRKSLLIHYNRAFYVPGTIQNWSDVQLNRVCTTQFDTNTAGHTWQTKFTWLWYAEASVHELCRHWSDNAPYNYSLDMAVGIFHVGHAGIPSEDAKRQRALSGHDRLLYEVEESRSELWGGRFAYCINILGQLGNHVRNPRMRFDGQLKSLYQQLFQVPMRPFWY